MADKDIITLPIDLYDEIWITLRKHMFWSEDGEEGNNYDVCDLLDKMEKIRGFDQIGVNL